MSTKAPMAYQATPQHCEAKVVDCIRHNAKLYADKTAMVDMASDRHFSYQDMHMRVGKLAGYLKAQGIGPGDRIAFLALNSTDILEIIYAAWRIGASLLALNYRLTAPEIEYIVNDSTPSMMIYDKTFEGVVEELKSTVDIKTYIETDGLGGPSSYEAAFEGVEPILEMVDQPLTQECMLMYSSGTTGRPKGVIITHQMILFSAVAGAAPIENTIHAVWLSIMPLFHIGGLNISSLPALWVGATTYIMRDFNPEVVLDTFNDPNIGVTHTIMVPAMYNVLRMHPKAETTDFSRVLGAFAGGASVPAELIHWWLKRGLIVRDGYGMTESAASNCLTATEDVPEHIGASGKSAMFTEMRIMDNDGNEKPYGEPGEIWMRGPTITPGYWNNEAANKEAFQNGWFKSGDIGRQDAEGRFTIEDRAKDMYISGGENVYPAEVEAVIAEMDEIAEVAVIGVPDERWGETGCVVAVLKPDYTLTLEAVRAHCDTKLARFKHPLHLAFMEQLPRNTTGKVKKFELRELAPSLMAQAAEQAAE